jgi:bifunctional DNA-binding transcriptional regulator/antitoxin component of YhaV-PrlF toxin-antitoxin module
MPRNRVHKSESDASPAGFDEAPVAPLQVALQIGADGRVLIPAELRRQMKIDASGRLTARIVDGELRLISPLAALDQLWSYVRENDKGSGSAVDELIAERRAEAARE